MSKPVPHAGDILTFGMIYEFITFEVVRSHIPHLAHPRYRDRTFFELGYRAMHVQHKEYVVLVACRFLVQFISLMRGAESFLCYRAITRGSDRSTPA